MDAFLSYPLKARGSRQGRSVSSRLCGSSFDHEVAKYGAQIDFRYSIRSFFWSLVNRSRKKLS